MERKESRDEGWGQGGAEGQGVGGRGTTRRESQKMEEENGSRRGKIGDWEAERQRKGVAQRRSQGRAGGRWREIEENPTGRGPDGRWWGGAYGIRRKNERSLRAGVWELEGGQGGLWGVLRGKGTK